MLAGGRSPGRLGEALRVSAPGGRVRVFIGGGHPRGSEDPLEKEAGPGFGGAFAPTRLFERLGKLRGWRGYFRVPGSLGLGRFVVWGAWLCFRGVLCGWGVWWAQGAWA